MMLSRIEPMLGDGFNYLRDWARGVKKDEDADTGTVLVAIIEGMTGIEPKMDWALEDCGLASIGVPVLVGLLNKAYSTKTKRVDIAVADLVTATTIADIAAVVDAAKALEHQAGV